MNTKKKVKHKHDKHDKHGAKKKINDKKARP